MEEHERQERERARAGQQLNESILAREQHERAAQADIAEWRQELLFGMKAISRNLGRLAEKQAETNGLLALILEELRKEG